MIEKIMQKYAEIENKKISKKEVQSMLKAISQVVNEEMVHQCKHANKDEKKIKVFNFGTLGIFYISYRGPRKLNLPSKAGSSSSSPTWVVNFKPSKVVKTSLKDNTKKK